MLTARRARITTSTWTWPSCTPRWTIRWSSWWVEWCWCSQVALKISEPYRWQFRERKYPLHFDGDMEHSLQRANCQKGNHRRGNRRMLRNKITERGELFPRILGYLQPTYMYIYFAWYAPIFAEKNKKRDVRGWYEPTIAREGVVDHRHQEVPTDVERGDIPVLNGDCEGRCPTAVHHHLIHPTAP